jgi:putative component of membrane protein insertase Oxa1/YidC/SpoIIIJ protein YidD
MIKKVIITLIEIYQKYISPHKGYCCAYRVYHGDLSCSEYAKKSLQSKKLYLAMKDIRSRFYACKDAKNYIDNEYEIDDKKDNSYSCCANCALDSCSIASCLLK